MAPAQPPRPQFQSPGLLAQRRITRFLSAVLLLSVAASCLVGCRQVEDSIEVYRLPKKEKKRVLAALIPHGSEVWIFKVEGSDARVQSFEQDFLGFLRTISFEDRADAEPQWKLPEGWGQLDDDHPRNAGRFPRFATVYKDDKKHVERMEVAVSSLPLRSGFPWQQYVKLNVDRWRGQLGLPEVAIDELEELTKEVSLENGLVATTVNFVEAGKQQDRGAAGAPETAAATTAQPKLPFKFKKPEGWSSTQGTTFSLLSFQVKDGAKQVDITVTPAGGALLPNVNRWRGQIGLESVDEQKLADELRSLKAGDVSFDYVRLVGADKTTLAAVGTHAGQMWFITLKGDNELARRETANFESFVQSLQFES